MKRMNMDRINGAKFDMLSDMKDQFVLDGAPSLRNWVEPASNVGRATPDIYFNGGQSPPYITTFGYTGTAVIRHWINHP